MEKRQSVAEIAGAAGLILTEMEAASIYKSLRPEKLKEIIAQREARGLAQWMPQWMDFDPETHWHKNHVGDGKIGKFRTQFSADQRRLLDQRFEPFLSRFNYSA